MPTGISTSIAADIATRMSGLPQNTLWNQTLGHSGGSSNPGSQAKPRVCRGRSPKKKNKQTQRDSTPCLRRLAAAHVLEQNVGGLNARRSADHEFQKHTAGAYQLCEDLQRPTMEDTNVHTRDHQTPSTHRRGGITNVTATPGTTSYTQGTTNVHDATKSLPPLFTTSGGPLAMTTNIHDELANATSESVPLNGRGFISLKPTASAPTNTAIALPSVFSPTFGSRSLGQHDADDNNDNMGSTTCSKTLLHDTGKLPLMTSPLVSRARDTVGTTAILHLEAPTVDTHTPHEVGTQINPTVLNKTLCGIMPQTARDKQHADHAGAFSTSASALADLPLREDGSVPTPLPTTASQVTKERYPTESLH